MTVGKNSRDGKTGGIGDKEVGEEEVLVDSCI